MDVIKEYIIENSTNGSSVMDLGINYFFSIIKRLLASKSKYALLKDGVLLSVYDINDDNDENGFNHAIVSLDNGLFYSQCKKLDVKYLYEKIRDDDKTIEELRKSKKIKPSKKLSEVSLTDDGFNITYYFSDEPIQTFSYKLLDVDEVFERVILEATNKMLNMYCDKSITIHEDVDVVLDKLLRVPRTLMREVSINCRNVVYPFMKSYLFGLNNPELMLYHINEVDVGKYDSNTDDNEIIGEVYGYTIILAKNKIVEFHSSYIVNYIN